MALVSFLSCKTRRFTRAFLMAQKEKYMNKLWQSNQHKLDQSIEAFETKADLLMDQKLIKYDCFGSLAHVKQLFTIGILTKDEMSKLEKGLIKIIKLLESGAFNLEIGDEDMHTKIEN